MALLLNGRVGPREQRVFVCTGKLLGSDRDSFQAFREVLYDFPRGLSRGQRGMGNRNLAFLFLRGKQIKKWALRCLPFTQENKRLY